MGVEPFHEVAWGRERCSAGDLRRHRHTSGYVTLVLGGTYIEAGDAGRFRARAGDILVHSPFDAHLDLFGKGSAQVLNLPLPPSAALPAFGRVEDPDAVAIVAERDPMAAASQLLSRCRAGAGEADWADLLAERLRECEPPAIGDWSRENGLAPATVSRGFRQVYGTTPERYRAEARARRAAASLRGGGRSLADLAAELGFADQAHMSRAVKALTGQPPRLWRDWGQTGSRPVPGGGLT
jgi:AraC-like DNA-binding protein